MTPSTIEKTKTLSADDLIQQLNWRYSTRKFDPTRKIPASQWEALEEALMLSPSSFGLQPWKFIVVNDPALRLQLKKASWNQSQITDASHMVVFALKKNLGAEDAEKLINRIAEVRGLSLESLDSYKKTLVRFVKKAESGFDINNWSAKQVYIALGFFLTSAAVLGIDTCPMEGIDPDAYDQILGLDKQGYHALCVATAGYRSVDDGYSNLAKVRYPEEDIIDRR